MTSQLWWYTARAGGIVAWSLLAASVLWGLFLSTRLRPGGVTPAWTLDLHRFLGGLALIFMGVHVVAIVLDSYVHFGIADVLVPFAASWHPLWVAWGIVSMYLLLAVELTSLTRRYLPHRIWRRVHILSLPLFLTATVHFLLAGTDSGNPFALLGMFICAAAVGGMLLRRMRGLRGTTPGSVRRPAAPGATRVVPAAPDRVPEPIGSPGT